MDPDKKGLIITFKGEIAKIFNLNTNILKARHFNMTSNMKSVKPYSECKQKNKKLKNLHCYFFVDKQFIHNIQIDCKLQIHADINNILDAL